MKRVRYIKNSLMPPRLNVANLLVWWMVLDYFHAPGWVYGVIYTMLIAGLIAELIRLIVGEQIDL